MSFRLSFKSLKKIKNIFLQGKISPNWLLPPFPAGRQLGIQKNSFSLNIWCFLPQTNDWELSVSHLGSLRLSWSQDGEKDVEWAFYVSLPFSEGETLGCFLREVAEGCEKFLHLPSLFLVSSQSEKHKYEAQELRRQCRRNIPADRKKENVTCRRDKTHLGASFTRAEEMGGTGREKWWGGVSTGRD